MKNVLILGCGYVGSRFAQKCDRKSVQLTVLTRSAERIKELGIADIVLEGDWCDQSGKFAIDQKIDILLCSVSHRTEEDSVIGTRINWHSDGLANVLNRCRELPGRIVYVSTTGVYQNVDDGRWIDEDFPCEPDRPGAVNAHTAEKWLMENHRDRSVILRPSGIYGPGRVPNIEALRERRPIAIDPNSYLNLIHVDDLVRVIDVVSVAEILPSSIYNVSDDMPCLREDYYQYLSQLVGAPSPEFAPKQVSDSTVIRARGQGNKRISNARLSRDLGIHWMYPTYRTGLESVLGGCNPEQSAL